MSSKQIKAPHFPDSLEWFNTEHPVNLDAQQGRVILLDFTTYCSLQCIATLDDLEYLENKYHDNILIIGIHSPRFPGERTAGHIRKVIARHGINHPIINDHDQRLKKLYGIKQQQTLVVIDTNGNITGATSGRNKRHKLDRAVGILLDKASKPATTPCAANTAPKNCKPSRALAFPGRIHATDNRIFIADSGHNRILVTTNRGHVLQQFGCSSPDFIDGKGAAAAFNNPQGMLLSDDCLYVADSGNHAIRRIHLHSEEVVTIAGTGKPGDPPQNSYFENPREVNLNTPRGLALKDNIIYIAMSGSHQIWALSLVPDTMEVIAGSGNKALKDGIAHLASFAQPSALSIMGNTLYVADAESSAIRAIDLATRNVTTIVGSEQHGYGYHDGFVPDARFQFPLDLNADQHSGALWIADTYNNKIRKIALYDNLVSSVTVSSPLNQPGGLAFSGNSLYIANTNQHEIIRINLQNGNTETLNVNDEDGPI
jgi:sugar lactone lactonase YvrE/peroxiredoxin